MTRFLARTVAAALSGLVILCAGCSRGPGLSPQAAAQLAATLANEQCDRLYQELPFRASQHPAILRNGTYEWGGFDPTGPKGLSALVSFRTDGSAPQVEVYFSCDPLSPVTPPKLPLHPKDISAYPR